MVQISKGCLNEVIIISLQEVIKSLHVDLSCESLPFNKFSSA